MSKDTIMFRFVPTMRCNFRCVYCFEPNNPKKYSSTMFDNHSVEDWVNAIKKFDDFDIELYFWGGEPFCIDGTYDFVRECCKLENIISGFRIDTNISFTNKILKKCPSSKIKLNCSYHMQYITLEKEFELVSALKEKDMVGMVNFVASPYNLKHLKDDYHMNVHDLIKKFESIDVFLNIAGDFAYANNPKYPRIEEYKSFIQQFISPDEWNKLRSIPREERLCSAGQKMFTIDYDGNFTSCISDRIYGNIFEGILNPDKAPSICKKSCPSLVAYPFRLDNDLPTINNMLAYVERNKSYRKSINKNLIELDFDFEDMDIPASIV